MSQPCVQEYFAKGLPFWSQLSAQEQQLLCTSAVTVTYDKGVNLRSDNRDCIGILFIKSGQLRVYLLSEDGREVTLYRLFTGETCVLSASCILDAISFDVNIDTEEPTELIVLPLAAVRQLLEKNIYVKNWSYEMAAERFSDVMWAMQQVLFMSFDRRLAIFLCDELNKEGGDTIKMTQEQIAKFIGSAREVVSRMLKYFASEGLVQVVRGGVKILEKEKLRALCSKE